MSASVNQPTDSALSTGLVINANVATVGYPNAATETYFNGDDARRKSYNPALATWADYGKSRAGIEERLAKEAQEPSAEVAVSALQELIDKILDRDSRSFSGAPMDGVVLDYLDANSDKLPSAVAQHIRSRAEVIDADRKEQGRKWREL